MSNSESSSMPALMRRLQLDGKDNPDLCIRPKSWRGQHMAYKLSQDGQTVLIIPCNNGKGHAHMTSQVSELVEEWEITTQGEVENGE